MVPFLKKWHRYQFFKYSNFFRLIYHIDSLVVQMSNNDYIYHHYQYEFQMIILFLTSHHHFEIISSSSSLNLNLFFFQFENGIFIPIELVNH